MSNPFAPPDGTVRKLADGPVQKWSEKKQRWVTVETAQSKRRAKEKLAGMNKGKGKYEQ